MRYFIGIVGALAGAVLVALFIGIPIADWAVARQSFNSPVAADDMHSWVYLASLFCGLVLGWLLGFMIGGRFESEEVDL